MASPPPPTGTGAQAPADQQHAGADGVSSLPPEVPVSTQFPVDQMLGAVDAIQAFHQQQLEENQRQQAGQAQQGANAPEGASEPAAAPAGGAGAGGGAADQGGKPLGYPGTFFLEKPLEGEAAQTLIRMWQPPGGPGYPPAGGYAGAPGYPPAGSAPPYPQPAYPGYPPAGGGAVAVAGGAVAMSGSSSAYPTVHHAVASAGPYPGSQPAYAASAHAPQAGVPPSMPPASSSGRKKAFIVGINYFGTSAQLRGCINDAKCMEYLLKNKFGFRTENMLMMTDDHPDPLRRPTKANMFQGFRWLMMDLKPGDSLVFHYSGHGSQQRDYSGEETDGMNETLCPMDFQRAGEIVDDDLNRVLINPLPTGVKLHAIIDACHSGSVMDLPYQSHVRGGYAQWESTYHFTRSHKGTAGGFAVQFGASKDSQTAADTQALSGNASTGAATFCFIQAIERRGTKLTYGELLIAMHNTLQEKMGPAQQGGSSGGLMGMLLGGGGGGGGYRGQEPVMSANYAFDMGYPFGL